MVFATQKCDTDITSTVLPLSQRSKLLTTLQVPTRSTNGRLTEPMAKNPARQGVFQTEELLERILLQLPAKNIFGVQRVCRRFRDCIAASPVIQRRMFLRLSDQTQAHWHIPSPRRYPGPLHPGLYVCSDPQEPCEVPDKFMPAKLNPLLQLSGLSMADVTHRVWRDVETVRFRFESRLRAQASWRNTFLTDPPIKFVSVVLLVYVDYRYGWFDFEVSNEDGLTLGAVVDAAFSTKIEAALAKGGCLSELEGGVTISDFMVELGQTGRDPASCVPMMTNIQLKGMVIPSEEEREISEGVVRTLPSWA